MTKSVLFWVILILLAGLSLCACAASMSASKQHRVRILDAETGEPIAGAVVSLHYYPSSPDSPDPNHPVAVADDQGEAMITVKDEIAIWQAQAAGYNELRLTGQKQALPPRFAAHAQDQISGVIYLYRLPEPALTILIPNNFTGALIVHLIAAAGFDWILTDSINTAFAAVAPNASYIQDSPGDRVFSQTASEMGEVYLVVTPLLYDLKTEQLQVRDPTGSLLIKNPDNAQDTDRCVWGSISEDEKKLQRQFTLFVGTQGDYQKYLQSPKEHQP